MDALRVPIVRRRHDVHARGPGDPAGHVAARRSSSTAAGSRTPSTAAAASSRGEHAVEIEVRGDFIVDCNGQPVDANAVGLSPAPTGNGTPGGTFLSSLPGASRGARARAKGAFAS